MKAPIIHQRDKCLPLLTTMIEIVDEYLDAPSDRIVTTRTATTGWGALPRGSVDVRPNGRGAITISTGTRQECPSLVVDERLAPWTGTDERPTLEEVRELLCMLAEGRMSREDDDIEILCRDLALLAGTDPPRKPQGTSGLSSARPMLKVRAPDDRNGDAWILWLGPVGGARDESYVPSEALLKRIAALPTEFSLTSVRTALTCSLRTAHHDVTPTDALATLRAMSGSSLRAGEAMERRP